MMTTTITANNKIENVELNAATSVLWLLDCGETFRKMEWKDFAPVKATYAQIIFVPSSSRETFSLKKLNSWVWGQSSPLDLLTEMSVRLLLNCLAHLLPMSPASQSTQIPLKSWLTMSSKVVETFLVTQATILSDGLIVNPHDELKLKPSTRLITSIFSGCDEGTVFDEPGWCKKKKKKKNHLWVSAHTTEHRDVVLWIISIE